MKWLLIGLCAIVVIVVGAAGLVIGSPGTALSIANAVQSAAQLSATSPTVQATDGAFQADRLEIQGDGFDIVIEALRAEVNLNAWWNESPYWAVRADRVNVTTSPATGEPQAADPSEPATIDLATAFSFSSIQVDELNVAEQTFSIRAGNEDGALRANVTGNVTRDVTGDVEGDAQTIALTLGHASPHPFTVKAQMEEAHAALNGRLTAGPQLDVTIEDGELRWQAHRADGLKARLGCGADFARCEVASFDAQLSPEGMEAFPVSLSGVVAGSDISAKAQIDTLALDAETSNGQDFRVELDANEWPGFLPSAPYTPEELVPFEIAATGRWADETLSVAVSKLNTPSHDLTAEGRFVLAGATDITLKVEGRKVYVPLVSGGTQATEEADAPAEDQPLFSAEPIDWTWLDTLALNVDVKLAQLVLQAAEFSDFALGINAADGTLTLKPFTGVLGDGGFEGTAQMTRQEDGVSLQTSASLQAVDLEAFGFVPQEELTGGQTTVSIDLATRGASPEALAAASAGHLTLIIDEAVLQNDMIEVIGTDIVMEALEKLNPFVRDDPSTTLECALVHFDVDEGVMKSEKQLVMETDKMEIVGGGNVNLATEAMKVTFNPTAKSGVVINAGSLVQFLAIGGTIQKPGLTVDALGALKTGATVGAALSTGGASLIAEGLIKRAANAGSACDRFRSGQLEEQEEAQEQEAAS